MNSPNSKPPSVDERLAVLKKRDPLKWAEALINALNSASDAPADIQIDDDPIVMAAFSAVTPFLPTGIPTADAIRLLIVENNQHVFEGIGRFLDGLSTMDTIDKQELARIREKLSKALTRGSPALN
jgi:hypothetical protein